MSQAEHPEAHTGFNVEDPVAAFRAFCREERVRARETDPRFDDALFQEAVALAVRRLEHATRHTPPPQRKEAAWEGGGEAP